MRVVSKRKLREVYEQNPVLKGPLEAWYKVAKDAEWKNLAEVKQTYRHADYVSGCTVFNIKGNDYRLIVHIKYEWSRIFIKQVLTHEEYDKGKWKNECPGD
jgi:mRNA interferase HigB